MPSLRAFILGLALILLALIQLSATSPVPAVDAADCKAPTPTLPSKPVATTPTVPTVTAATPLPAAPPANQTLQYVALGRGVQNYTCTSIGSAPVALGAIATLYDGTALATANEAEFNSLPPLAVYVANPKLPASVASLAVLGNHYFAADGTPTFNLSSKGKILFAKKNGDVAAPANANKGPSGTGAVDWLQLVAKPGYATVGLQTVYRVVTAGGNPPAVCPSVGVISEQYAAEYWFYD
ncbi:hypothetical protein D0Z07_6202 [Hyphodiscus hymeniophilus]|uniref:Malate dehydrogenase n=1 Tax=Hyphodiscus hymeniophilus TaxID=353542 RepID=A0A9P6VFE0_9HELO|nr:hypothetical protein D0Z07_6202 [Hyphodiscus hymeniophilus]